MTLAPPAGIADAEDDYGPSACGPQADGTKKSAPCFCFSKASRDARAKVFISNKHPQDLLGKDSPGFAYSPKRQLSLPSHAFGTSAARPPVARAKYPETSGDLLGTLPDKLTVKHTEPRACIGECPRDAPSNAPDLVGFPKGKISPGPQRYRPERAPPCHRLPWAPRIDEVPPTYTIRKKTKIMEETEIQTPARVGPGLYPVTEACQPQPRSEKKSLPQWSFPKKERFSRGPPNGDSGRLWDGMGDVKISKNRMFSSTPSFSFGTSTRQNRSRTAHIQMPSDKGPAANMEKPVHSQPQKMHSRTEILKFQDLR